MDTEKRVAIGNKINAFAYAFVGIGIFSYGTSYFQERLLYNVPRILIPVFEIFGNIGLAIGMLILGGGLIYWGFTKWKSVFEKKNLYWIIAVVGLAVGVVLANVNFNPNKSAEILEEMHQKTEAQAKEREEAFRNAGELSFRNPHADAHIAKFNELYKRFKNLENVNEESINALDEELIAWAENAPNVFEKLKKDEKAEFGRYIGKITLQWQDLRMKYFQELEEE